jgi:uncharacterized protein (DUF362 family)
MNADMSFNPAVAAAALSAASDSRGEATRDALALLAATLGWADRERGPFARVIAPGMKVLIKPNLVLHENEGPWGLAPLVTDAALVRAASEAALQAGASQVTVGDAPIQSCDLACLLQRNGLADWARATARRDPRFTGIRDFRRTTCVLTHGVRVAAENLQPEDHFVLFDLGRDSLLEPITRDGGAFRVTWYDPRLMARTHGRGRHQYLIAKDVLDADVVINLPKLKTHKKAGVTCALKNLIGINGNKEYLPHHRIGGAAAGGDCYPNDSYVKRALETIADWRNQTQSRTGGLFYHALTFALTRVLRARGDRLGYEGSWSGNDTIWRTCLDLNRILLYGQADGRMAETPQRRVLHLVDAVIAGQGDGPLAPKPLPLGMLFAGHNAAAVDWVAAHLLGYDASRIPLVREAFGGFKWPLAPFAPGEVRLAGDFWQRDGMAALAERALTSGVEHPIGWRTAALSRPATRDAA